MDLNEIGNTISDIILSEYNKKIKYDLGLEDYLKSYTKDELLKFYATYLVYNDKLDELLTFKAINGQKKDEIISKVSSNISYKGGLLAEEPFNFCLYDKRFHLPFSNNP